jgi:hypothetical protein
MSGSHSQSPRFRLPEISPLARLSTIVTTTVETVAFWLSIVFPLTYLPLLGDGVAAGELLPFVALLAGHCLALTLGHDYGR